MDKVENEAPIKVLLVDDHDLVREGLKATLRHQEDLTVVAEASNGADAVTQARLARPDLVVMDVRMPDIGEKSRRPSIGSRKVRSIAWKAWSMSHGPVETARAMTSGLL